MKVKQEYITSYCNIFTYLLVFEEKNIKYV